jgi:hypothetical protein
MVLTVSFALSPVTGLVCHRHPAEKLPAKLDASVGASGPHDFSVRFSAARLASPKRPSHPVSNVRDDRDTPLLSGTGRREFVEMICPTGIAKYFCKQGWTPKSPNSPSGKSVWLSAVALAEQDRLRCAPITLKFDVDPYQEEKREAC